MKPSRLAAKEVLACDSRGWQIPLKNADDAAIGDVGQHLDIVAGRIDELHDRGIDALVIASDALVAQYPARMPLFVEG